MSLTNWIFDACRHHEDGRAMAWHRYRAGSGRGPAKLILALTGLMVTSCQGGPERSNLSGEWRFNPEKSQLGLQNLRSMKDASLHIEHNDPAFSLRRTFVVNGQESHVSFELASDGREVRLEGDRELYSRLHWEESELIFTTRIIDPAGEGVNRVAYRLLGDGRTLQAREQFRSPGLSYDNLWVFDRE